MRLEFYEPDELEEIVSRGARVLGAPLAPDGAAEIARRARGTPRVATRLLRRVRDIAAVMGDQPIDAARADAALNRLEVDGRGLDAMDRRYLTCVAENYVGHARSISYGRTDSALCNSGASYQSPGLGLWVR